MSRTENGTIIDQLWYTWSRKGLEDIHMGYRIRAASAGLHNIRNIRVQALDRFQRYQLPSGADPVIAQSPRNPGANDDLNVAPICLSLIDLEKERVLVHKVYTGRDALGRPGVFFVHLLAWLPESFTAAQAIQLWNSPFWQHSDVTLQDERNTLLDQVSLEHVMATVHPLPYNQQHIKNLDNYLAYVIHAYLLMKDSSIKKTEYVAHQLYIAASDENIARLIRGLTRCLPQPLLSRLTFSTYERNPEDAETEIVGTGWLTVPNAEHNVHTTHLLPSRYYQERLALNCYSGQSSPLENNPLIENKPIAAVYAHRAKNYFLEAIKQEFTPAGARFKDFLDREQHCESIERLLSDFALFLQNESRVEERGRPNLPGLISAAIRVIGTPPAPSMPAHSPIDIIRAAIPYVIETIETELKTGKPAIPDSTKKIASCEQLVAYMKRNTLSQQGSELWVEFLLRLRSVPDIATFFFTDYHWNCYKDLIEQLATTLPDANDKSTLLAPLLAPTWSILGAFLQLQVPPSWTIVALKTLAYDGTTPTPTDALLLVQSSYRSIKEICNVLWLEKEYQWVVILLLSKLTRVGYTGKIDIVKPLLHKGASPQTIEWLLSGIRASLTKDELALISEDYVVAYIPSYPTSIVLLDYLRDYFYGLLNEALTSSNSPLANLFGTMNRKIERVVDCIAIVIMNTATSENAITVMQQLAFTCTADVRVFKELIRGLERRWQTNRLSSLHLFLFLYDLAIYIGEDISHNERKQALLLPYIVFADTFTSFLQEKKGRFIDLFTRALLLYANQAIFQKLLNQVDKELKNAGPWKIAIWHCRLQKQLSLAQTVWHMQNGLQQIDRKNNVEYQSIANRIADRFESKNPLLQEIYTIQTCEMRKFGREWITKNFSPDDVSQEDRTVVMDYRAGSNS